MKAMALGRLKFFAKKPDEHGSVLSSDEAALWTVVSKEGEVCCLTGDVSQQKKVPNAFWRIEKRYFSSCYHDPPLFVTRLCGLRPHHSHCHTARKAPFSSSHILLDLCSTKSWCVQRDQFDLRTLGDVTKQVISIREVGEEAGYSAVDLDELCAQLKVDT